MHNIDGHRLRALSSAVQSGQVKEKIAVRFLRKSENSEDNDGSNDEIYKTEVTSGDSEDMCSDRVRLKDRILEGVSKAVKEVCQQRSEFGSFACLLHTQLHCL